MTFTTDLKKTVTEAHPVYAVVGATDLAAEKLRTAREQAVATRRTIASVDAKSLQRQVQDVPATILERSLELANKAQQQYDELVVRGEQLVGKVRTQKSTQDLVAQAEQTVAIGKGAVTTVRKAVSDTQASAKATITTGKHQASRVAGVVSDVVAREAKDVSDAVDEVTTVAEDAAAATTTAAKRTRTTARKGAKATTARAKATTTSARKAAPRARKAAKTAAEKVGA